MLIPPHRPLQRNQRNAAGSGHTLQGASEGGGSAARPEHSRPSSKPQCLGGLGLCPHLASACNPCRLSLWLGCSSSSQRRLWELWGNCSPLSPSSPCSPGCCPCRARFSPLPAECPPGTPGFCGMGTPPHPALPHLHFVPLCSDPAGVPRPTGSPCPCLSEHSVTVVTPTGNGQEAKLAEERVPLLRLTQQA